jgi:hypothetical protein
MVAARLEHKRAGRPPTARGKPWPPTSTSPKLAAVERIIKTKIEIGCLVHDFERDRLLWAEGNRAQTSILFTWADD